MAAAEHTVTMYEVPGALADAQGYRLYGIYVTGTIEDDDILVFSGEDVLLCGVYDQVGTIMAFDAKSAASGLVKYTVNATTATTVTGLVRKR